MTDLVHAGGFTRQLPDNDVELTGEWVESLDAFVDAYGPAVARLMLARLLKRAGERDVGYPTAVSTPYVNTISPIEEPAFPGDAALEARIEAFVRWNAAVMVTRANILSEGIGGHMATPASCTSLYEVGFNHFFHGKDADVGDGGQPGDQVFFQGHAAPGIYARAFLEGRLGEDQVDRFRREIGGVGLSSYPHPRLMPEFWEFPTVSMGLARSMPSTRPASTGTCTTGASSTPARPRCGASWATASATSPRRSAPCGWRPASASTT